VNGKLLEPFSYEVQVRWFETVTCFLVHLAIVKYSGLPFPSLGTITLAWTSSLAMTTLATNLGSKTSMASQSPCSESAKSNDQQNSQLSSVSPSSSTVPTTPLSHSSVVTANQPEVNQFHQRLPCPHPTRILVLVSPSLDDNHKLTQIKVPSGMTVTDFFKQFKRKYFRHRGLMAYFSVWKYHHCDFYHVSSRS
jgi:hypothetical protein